MSSEIWDWLAIATGLQPADGMFIPLYWLLPAKVFAVWGWAPSAGATLLAWIAVSLAAVALFVWTRRWLFLDGACLLWGALLADTPYGIVFPMALVVAWTLLKLFAGRQLRKKGYLEVPSPRARCCFVCVVAFILAMTANFVRCNLGYLTGYARNAVAAARGDGFARNPRTAARMDGLLNAYVAELAREGEGCRWIFTDGFCHAGIDLAAGGRLRAVSLAGGAADEATWRARGFSHAEDLAALEGGACRLLRAWTVDRPENLTNAVYQCAFAFLEQEAPEKTAPCGLVMRAGAVAAAERDRADAAVRGLGERIADFYAQGGDPTAGGRRRCMRFCTMQWRVARAIRRRAAALDRARRTDEALAATAFSEKLDALNPFAKKLDAETGTADLRAFGAITPREGLTFALRRANFALARRYAQAILKDDPADAAANFAFAMNHLAAKEYAQARHYLEKAVAARPDDPTLLNNLAVTLLELGETEAARTKAEAALKCKPDSEAIRNTLKQIAGRRASNAARP